jgi:hypothetical protein
MRNVTHDKKFIPYTSSPAQKASDYLLMGPAQPYGSETKLREKERSWFCRQIDEISLQVD